VTTTGKATGNLFAGNAKIPLNGTFSPEGTATLLGTASKSDKWTNTLTLDFDHQQINGTVSDAGFQSLIHGDLEVFTSKNKTLNAGQYTLAFPGTNSSSEGPLGNSCGTVKITSSGVVTFAGTLGDGSPAFSQSSFVAPDGTWPLYVPLYGGQGSLLGWGLVSNNTLWITNLSWINPTNTSRSADYQSGFTNGNVETLTSAFANSPLFGTTHAQIILSGGGLAKGITNAIFIKADGAFTNVPDASYGYKIAGTISKSDGTVSGTFDDPANKKRAMSFKAVVLQDETNAPGWFTGTNHIPGTVTITGE
jgi:hypothetical protein